MTSVGGVKKSAAADECVIPAKIQRQISLGTSPAPRLYYLLFTDLMLTTSKNIKNINKV